LVTPTEAAAKPPTGPILLEQPSCLPAPLALGFYKLLKLGVRETLECAKEVGSIARVLALDYVPHVIFPFAGLAQQRMPGFLFRAAGSID
jgi:hypothetical protein